MAVHAIAVVLSPASVGAISTTDYTVGAHYMVRDGANSQLGAYTASVMIPFGTDSVLANRMLREAIAAEILSAHSLVIDPSDIYCPGLQA